MPGKRYAISLGLMCGLALVITWFSSALAAPIVKGRVLNNQGAAVSGYPVTISSPAKSVTVYTNHNGDFVVYGLNEGRYRVAPINQPPEVSKEIEVSPSGAEVGALKLH